MSALNQSEIDQIKSNSGDDVQRIIRDLEDNVPSLTEGLGALAGAGVGGAGAMAALSGLGSVAGLSAAGITSGLAAAGSVVGGGMVAGVGVLAAPVAILGIAGYAFMKRNKVKKQTAALTTAMASLYDVQQRLMEHAEHFKEELAGLNVLIKSLRERGKAMKLGV